MSRTTYRWPDPARNCRLMVISCLVIAVVSTLAARSFGPSFDLRSGHGLFGASVELLEDEKSTDAVRRQAIVAAQREILRAIAAIRALEGHEGDIAQHAKHTIVEIVRATK